MNLITNPNEPSYNTAVNAINKHQRENVKKLNLALTTSTAKNIELSQTMNELAASIYQIKRQLFMNDSFIRNWSQNAPYSYDTSLLN